VPKQRKKRKPVKAAPTQPSKQNQVFPRWIRISAIVLILMLMLSALVGAIVSGPAKAAELTSSSSSSPSFTPNPTCAPQDTDHDGIPNNIDPDIDGDGIPNGLDPDINGNGIPNALDPDPASTNCGSSTTPPENIRPTVQQQLQSSPWRIPVILVIAAAGVGYILLRRRRGQKAKSGKVD
jgi:hypothetical protein